MNLGSVRKTLVAPVLLASALAYPVAFSLADAQADTAQTVAGTVQGDSIDVAPIYNGTPRIVIKQGVDFDYESGVHKAEFADLVGGKVVQISDIKVLSNNVDTSTAGKYEITVEGTDGVNAVTHSIGVEVKAGSDWEAYVATYHKDTENVVASWWPGDTPSADPFNLEILKVAQESLTSADLADLSIKPGIKAQAVAAYEALSKADRASYDDFIDQVRNGTPLRVESSTTQKVTTEPSSTSPEVTTTAPVAEPTSTGPTSTGPTSAGPTSAVAPTTTLPSIDELGMDPITMPTTEPEPTDHNGTEVAPIQQSGEDTAGDDVSAADALENIASALPQEEDAPSIATVNTAAEPRVNAQLVTPERAQQLTKLLQQASTNVAAMAEMREAVSRGEVIFNAEGALPVARSASGGNGDRETGRMRTSVLASGPVSPQAIIASGIRNAISGNDAEANPSAANPAELPNVTIDNGVPNEPFATIAKGDIAPEQRTPTGFLGMMAVLALIGLGMAFGPAVYTKLIHRP